MKFQAYENESLNSKTILIHINKMLTFPHTYMLIVVDAADHLELYTYSNLN